MRRILSRECIAALGEGRYGWLPELLRSHEALRERVELYGRRWDENAKISELEAEVKDADVVYGKQIADLIADRLELEAEVERLRREVDVLVENVKASADWAVDRIRELEAEVERLREELHDCNKAFDSMSQHHGEPG